MRTKDMNRMNRYVKNVRTWRNDKKRTERTYASLRRPYVHMVRRSAGCGEKSLDQHLGDVLRHERWDVVWSGAHCENLFYFEIWKNFMKTCSVCGVYLFLRSCEQVATPPAVENRRCGYAIHVLPFWDVLQVSHRFSEFLFSQVAPLSTLCARGIQTMQLFTLHSSTAQTCGFLSLDLIQSPPEVNALKRHKQWDSETLGKFKYIKTKCRAQMLGQFKHFKYLQIMSNFINKSQTSCDTPLTTNGGECVRCISMCFCSPRHLENKPPPFLVHPLAGDKQKPWRKQLDATWQVSTPWHTVALSWVTTSTSLL